MNKTLSTMVMATSVLLGACTQVGQPKEMEKAEPQETLIGRTVGIWLSLEFNRSADDFLPSFIPSAIRWERIGGID